MTKKEFNEKLKKNGLSLTDFAKETNLPYATIAGWNGEEKPFPTWLESWFKLHEKSILLDNIKNAFLDAFAFDKK